MTRRAALLLLLLAVPAVAQEGVGGTWQGTYTCNQGNTALTLTISPVDKERVSALFAFEAAPDNPGVPSGCFEMTGRFDARSGSLHLEPSHWVRRPGGYIMVGLDGQVRGNGSQLAGTVDGPGCTTFRLARRSLPNAIAACRNPGAAASPG